jgi:hypothetical protein
MRRAMGRIRSLVARPQGKLLGVVLLLGLAGGGTYAAAGGGKASTGTGPHQSIVIHHATAAPTTSPAKIGAGSRVDAVANVLDVDVKIGEFHSDYMTYARISSDALAQYSASFDSSQYTVVPTQGGRNFYVCARSGKWYAEQKGLRTAVKATLKPSPLCKL